MKSKEKNNCRTISVFEAVRRANFYSLLSGKSQKGLIKGAQPQN